MIWACVLLIGGYWSWPATFAQEAAKGSAETIQGHFQNAQKAQNEGDLFRAESEYRQSLGLALEQLGGIYNTLGDLDKAALAYSSATRATVDSEVALLGLGVVDLRKGDYEKGVEVVRTLLAQDAFDPKARDLLGKLYFAMNQYDAAAQELEEATRLEPDNISASFTLALIFLKQHQPERAQRVFTQVQTQLGDSARLHMFFGGAYRQADYANEAVREFQKAAAIDSKYPQVHYNLALTYLSQEGAHKFSQAIEELKKELQRKPNDYLANSLLGMVYQQQHKLEEAIPYLEKATRLEPQKPDAYLMLGQVLYVSGQQEKSIPLLRRAIELTADPSRNEYQIANGQYLLGQALLRQGKIDEAKQHLALAEQYKSKSSIKDQERLKIFFQNNPVGSGDSPESITASESKTVVIVPPPPSATEKEKLGKAAQIYARIAAQAYNQLGLLHASQADFKKAAEYFAGASGWDPQVPDVYYNLGLAQFKAQNYAEAIAPLEKVRAQQPKRQDAQTLLGMSYFFSGDYAHAKDQLDPLVESGLDDPQALYALGLSLAHSGAQPRGESMLRGLVQRYPNVADAHMAVGQALAMGGKYEPAAAEFARALELDSAMPEAHYFLGLSLVHQAKFSEAAKEFQQELTRDPNDAKSRYHLGLCLVSMNRMDEAVQSFNEALRLKPSYPEAYYELGKARLAQGQTEEAVSLLEKAAKLDGEKSYIQYQLSQAYLKAGKADAAQAALARYRELKVHERSATAQHGTSAEEPREK